MRRETLSMSFFVKSITLIFAMFFLTQMITLARSGCCSHHGGVCGCGCCDGSSLSATCAPYYPSCQSTGNTKKTKQTPKKKYIPSKPTSTTYSKSQYDTIISEKNNLLQEKSSLEKERDTLTQEKETLTKETEDLKNEISTLKETIKEKEETNNKKTALLKNLNQTTTSITKNPENTTPKQNIDKEDDSNNTSKGDNGLLSFLLGGGAMYGASRLKRRQELKKEGVQIKGNITRDGQKIYYIPDSRYYDMVKINKKKGEKWFLSEEEALNAGWRKA